MSYTRDDFVTAIAAEVSNYPAAALAYQAGDPRLLASLDAMATMFAMVSQQIDTESMEPFIKARDTTVLADASMKGILPFARPPRVALSITNGATTTLNIAVGRRLIDQNGRVYVTETQAAIAAGATSIVNAKQVTTRTLTHTVANSTAFYGVQIPPNDDTEQIISGIYVTIGTTTYPYTPEFQNLAAGEAGYSLETDEQRRLWVKFGWANTVGVQPSNGTVINFTIEETFGANVLSSGATFTFETSASSEDRQATLTLSSVLFAGADPLDIDTLREYAKYPSTYDSSAVYLGNFDFLIRRTLFPLRFLSVWNEQVEEAVRGASVANINKLFIAVLMDGVDTTWLQTEIRRIIKLADDSYSVNFVNAVTTELPVTINAQVSVVHDVGDVEAKIRAVVYDLYGKDSQAAAKGMMQMNNKKLSDSLKTNVVALQDDGSDLQVSLAALPVTLPEQYRYVSEASLTVNVTQATYNDGMWSF
jgi:hypothetical protein